MCYVKCIVGTVEIPEKYAIPLNLTKHFSIFQLIVLVLVSHTLWLSSLIAPSTLSPAVFSERKFDYPMPPDQYQTAH